PGNFSRPEVDLGNLIGEASSRSAATHVDFGEDVAAVPRDGLRTKEEGCRDARGRSRCPGWSGPALPTPALRTRGRSVSVRQLLLRRLGLAKPAQIVRPAARRRYQQPQAPT